MTATSWLTVFAGALGLCMGCLLILNGFEQGEQKGVLQQSARLKNLLWVLGGLGVIVFGDFRRLARVDEISMLEPAAAYLLGVLGGAVLLFGGFSLSYVASVRRYNRENRGVVSIDALDIWRAYMTRGKTHADKLFEARKTSLADRARAKEPQSLAAMSGAVRDTLDFLEGAADETRREKHTRALCEHIIAFVKSQVEDPPTIGWSWMSYARAASLPEPPAKVEHYEKSPPACDGYLFLEDGGQSTRRGLTLPVASDHEAILPGAAMAVVSKRAVISNFAELSFGSKVPTEVKAHMRHFFQGPYFKESNFKSATSFPIMRGKELIGVLNLDSSKPDLVDLGPDMMRTIERRLQPLLALCSTLPRAHLDRLKASQTLRLPAKEAPASTSVAE